MNTGLRFIYERPSSPKHRLIRSSVLGSFILTSFLLLSHLAIAEPGASIIEEWPIASLITGVSLLTTLGIVLLPWTVRKAVYFYVLEQVVLLPASLGLMSIGLNTLGLFGSELVAIPIIVGIGAGSIIVNSRMRRRRPQIEEAIRVKSPVEISGDRALWDCTRDSLQGFQLSDMRGSSPAGRILFWLGPAAGVITARMLGSDLTSLLVGFILLGLGYLMTVLKIEVAASYYLVLKKMERETDRVLILRNLN